MKRFIALAIFLSTLAGTAQAGPNAGGVLLVHANTSIGYTTGVSYGGQAGITRAGDVVTSVPVDSSVVCFVLAAFPNGSNPHLRGVTFGIAYPAWLEIVTFGHSFGDFELSMLDWPASGSGTALTATERAERSSLIELYWFVARVTEPGRPATLSITPHPEHGGTFADDAIPATLDQIAGYSGLGFGEPGFFEPVPPPSLESRLMITPNPVRTIASIKLDGIAGHPDFARITDVTGRLVRRLPFDGAREVLWDRKDSRGARVRAGVYYVSVDDLPSQRLVVVE